MRRLILTIAAGLFLAGAAATAADSPNAALCRPIQQEWNSVGSGTNLTAMQHEMGKIPPFCSDVRAQAARRIAAVKAENAARLKANREQAAAGAAQAEAARERAAEQAEAAREAAQQQQVPVQVSNGLTLMQTYDLIKTELVAQGAVTWAGFAHDSDPPAGQVSDWTYHRTLTITDFNYSPDDCTFRFHSLFTTDGKTTQDTPTAGVPFRESRVIRIWTEVGAVEKADAQAGHPSWTTRTSPDIYVVEVFRQDGGDNSFNFYDIETARRVAGLFQHAAQLCGVTNLQMS